jgi:hypothetical protein
MFKKNDAEVMKITPEIIIESPTNASILESTKIGFLKTHVRPENQSKHMPAIDSQMIIVFFIRLIDQMD